MSEQKNFKDIAKQISEAIELDTGDTPEGLIEKIKLLSVLTASAAALQANAKKELLRKELEILSKHKDSDMQPSVLMRTISAECFEEAGWLTYAERLNAGISNSIEGLRSALSFLKLELEQTRGQV